MKCPDWKKLLPAIITGTIIMLIPFGTVSANPITGLYSTGVNNAGNVVNPALGTTDLHYTVTSAPIAGVVATDAYYGNPWMPNTATAGWVAPLYPAGNPNRWYGAYYTGTYAFTTTFTLDPNINPLTAWFTANVASDNGTTSILLNGHVVGQALGGLAVFNTITVSSFFVTGLNTLTFNVYNASIGGAFAVGNPSGLLVDIKSSYVSVPEPATYALILSALTLLVLMRLTKSRTKTTAVE